MKNYSQYLGFLIAIIYGLGMRLLGGQEFFNDFFHIYSISFLWITPIIIGLIPILFAHNEIYKSKLKLVTYPMVAILLFLLMAIVVRIEDFLCIIILGMPFFTIAGILGLVIGFYVKERVQNKKLLSLVILPFITHPIEQLFPDYQQNYSVQSEIIIHNTPHNIFPNLIEVLTIQEHEYNSGWLQIIGIPRPIASNIIPNDSQIVRIGSFTDNFKLYEYVSEIRKNEFVNFKIDLHKSTLRDKPTDQHLLKNEYFKFENINYTLIENPNHTTTDRLNCDYTIHSKMNRYGNFWASIIIKDFEERLLQSLEKKLSIDNQ